MMNLETYLLERTRRINAELDRILDSGPHPERLVQAMRHSLMAGGKRIRPVLCMAAAEAVSGNGDRVLPVACAIEIIHTYSLIHDDLPAMDNDSLRRGKPTCHVAFDEATAILAGDALLTLAFEVLAGVECDTRREAGRLLKIIGHISRSAGYKGMVQGQMLDMASEGNRLDLEALQAIHTLKTGAMITTAVVSGAMMAGAYRRQAAWLERYAENIGLAFQITDDILNVEGNPELLGKAVGTDHVREKNTYPSIIGLAASRKAVETVIDKAIGALAGFDEKADPLREIAWYISRRNR